MKISYRGMKKGLPALQQAKLDAKLAKLAKMLDGPAGEKEAHVAVSAERHLSNAEITLHYMGHQMVGIGSDADLFAALSKAVDKTEKQVAKVRAKWRAKIREEKGRKTKAPVGADELVGTYAADGVARIYRVDHYHKAKPLTIDEALLQMEDGRSYLVYRDAERDAISVLLRRKDGHFDLVEA